MRKYDYIPQKQLRCQYHRRFSWMRLAMIVIPVALWSGGLCLLILAAAMSLGLLV